MNSSNSETTGFQPLASALENATGMPRSGYGATSLVSSSESDRAREWLLSAVTPRGADEALSRSLTSTLGCIPNVTMRSMFPEGKEPYSLAVRCEFQIANEANRPAAIDKVKLAMTEATDRQLSEWLSLLQAATAHRAEGEGATAAGYAVYLSALRKFPADVAKAACERLARGKPGAGVNWFPTLAELVDECEIYAAPRQVMLAALERWKPEQPASKRGHATKAERAKALEMAKDFGAYIDAEKAKRPKAPELPPIHAKVDETGVSQELRMILARQAGENL